MADREAGMMTTTGEQGVGKTYQNMHVIANYVKDKIDIKVRGRKCLILDTNGEYTLEQFARNGVKNFDAKRISLSDIPAWSASNIVECRRIDAKNASIQQKKDAIEYCLRYYRNGMFVIEDINTYILSLTHMEEIVGGLVNLRHRACDVLISYQSLRPVEPRIWQNSRWIRMHHQADDVNDIRGKITDPTLFKIAQLIVNNRYDNGDTRFFVYIHVLSRKIEGNFTLSEFETACRQFLSVNEKFVKEYKKMYQCSDQEALQKRIKQYIQQYYGNDAN